MSTLKLKLKWLAHTIKILRFQTKILSNSTKKDTYTTRLSTKLWDIMSISTPLTAPEEIESLAKHATYVITETANGMLGGQNKDEKPLITEDIIQQCDQKLLYSNKPDQSSWDTNKQLKKKSNEKFQRYSKPTLARSVRTVKPSSRKATVTSSSKQSEDYQPGEILKRPWSWTNRATISMIQNKSSPNEKNILRRN